MEWGYSGSRRYESLKDALWSQILLEQEPERFAMFFREGVGT